MNGNSNGFGSAAATEYIRRHHRHETGENQCTSAIVKHIKAPVPLVWSLVRRFDQPQKYKPFVSRCVAQGNLEIGSLREVDVKSGLPATTSTERLELLDDDEHILSIKIVGGDHRLEEFMASLPPEERVILVGHSKGGFCISASMERFPEKIAVAVFAPAFMPGPNLTFQTLSQQVNERLDSDKYMDTQFGFHNGMDEPAISVLFGTNLMASKFYQLSPLEDLTLALTLVRHVCVYKDQGSIKATAVTKEKYGLVHRVYIVCNKDNVIQEDFQRWMIENNPPDEVKLISGSDHIVMFSKPKELCSCLQEIAEKYS